MDNIDNNNQILFVGSHTHTIDEKKRFIFPSSWRNLNLLNRMYVFPHPELPCLNIYFTDEITRRLNKLRDESIDQKESHAIRSITSSADLISWDSQGRVRISDHLLRHLEIKSQLVLVGEEKTIKVGNKHMKTQSPCVIHARRNLENENLRLSNLTSLPTLLTL